MDYGQAQGLARETRALSAPPPPTQSSVGNNIGEALDAIQGTHQRLNMLESRIMGDRPEKAEPVPTPPNGLAEATLRLRSLIISLNDRLDGLSAAI